MIVSGAAPTRYPYTACTIGSLVTGAAKQFGENLAIVDGGRRLTWADVDREVDAVARALYAEGIRHGDHMAAWLPNQLEWVLTWFAAARIGAVLIPVNTRYKLHEVDYILRQSDARLLIMRDKFLGIDFHEMLNDLCPHLATTGPSSERLPELRSIVVLGTAPDGAQTWSDFLAAGKDVDASVVRSAQELVSPDDPTIIVYTSGTTGHPKGALHSHRILRNEHSISEAMDISSSSVVMNHLPFFHVGGGFTGVLPPLITGGAMVIMDRWDVGQALRLIQDEGVTVFSGTPTHFIDVLNHPERIEFDISTLHSGWIGGANNPPQVLNDVVDVLGVDKLLPVYGMTETTSITTIPRLEDGRDVVLSGKGLPVSDFEVKLIAPDTGAELDPETEGEVCVRGHSVMQGYYKNEEATRRLIDDEGWFHTGDLGVLGEDGYLQITGRLTDLFIVGGSNAYPAEIESVLSKCPGVLQSYVVGVPHPRLGEVGYAFVQRSSRFDIDEDSLLAFCREHLANYKVPHTVVFVDEWPLTATGKIQRFVLKERAVDR
jgi:fatty-acyl-CoA synthase